jgi:hypothetical protein
MADHARRLRPALKGTGSAKNLAPLCWLLMVLLSSAGCDEGKKCSAGTDGCACYGNGTCNQGLACVADVCRPEGDAGEDAADLPVGEDAGEDAGTEEDGGADPDAVADTDPDITEEDVQEEPGVPCTDYTGQDPGSCPEGQVCSGAGTCITLPAVCTQEVVTQFEALCDGNTVVRCTELFSRMEGDVEVFYIGFSGESETCAADERCLDYEFMLKGGEGACDGPLPWAACIPLAADACDMTVNADCIGTSPDGHCDADAAFNCSSIELDQASSYAVPMQGIWEEEDCGAAGFTCRLTPYDRAVCVDPDAILCIEWFQYCDGSTRHRCEPDSWEEIQDCSAAGGICYDGCPADPADSACVPAGTVSCDPYTFIPYCLDASTMMTCSFYCAALEYECTCYILEDGELVEVPCDCVDGADGAECVVIEEP